MELELIVHVPNDEINVDKEQTLDISIEFTATEILNNVSVELIDSEDKVVACSAARYNGHSATTIGKIVCPKNQGSVIRDIYIYANNRTFSTQLKHYGFSNTSKDNAIIIDNCKNVDQNSLHRDKSNRYIVKNSEFANAVEAETYTSYPLTPTEHIPEKLIDKPAYVRVQTEEQSIFSIQAFRQKARFGKGAFSASKDANVRLFQSLSERLNEQQLVNDDFQSIQGRFSKAHFVLEFNANNQLVYRHLARAKAKLPTINKQPLEECSTYERNQRDDQVIFDILSNNTNNNNFELNFLNGTFTFNIKLTPGFYASVKCQQLPHLGEVIIFNTNNPECENVRFYCSENSRVYVKTRDKQWYINYPNAAEHPVTVVAGDKIKL